MPPFAQRPERLAKKAALAPSQGSVARALAKGRAHLPKLLKCGRPKRCRRERKKRDEQNFLEEHRADYAELVGPVSESKRAHQLRHSHIPGGKSPCPRCRWYACGNKWLSHNAVITEPALRNELGNSWLIEKPIGYGGTWSVGCSICHRASVLFNNRLQDGKAQRKQRGIIR